MHFRFPSFSLFQPSPSAYRALFSDAPRYHAAPQGVTDFADLFLAAANAFWAVGDAPRALRFLAPLRLLPDYGAPPLWARMATCYAAAGDTDGAAAMYEDVLATHPGHPDAASALAELLLQLGRTQDALARLDLVPMLQQRQRGAPPPLRLRGVAHVHDDGGGGGGGGGDDDDDGDGDGGAAGGGFGLGLTPDEAEEDALRRLRAARLRGAAGDANAFLDVALPLVRQSLEAEAAAAAAAVAAAAAGHGRRGGRKAKPRAPGAPHADGVFRGYVTKPRKRSRRRRDAADDEAAAAAAPLPLLARAPPAPPAVRGLLAEPEKFSIFRAVFAALLGARRLDEAAALVDGALALGRAAGGSVAAGRERVAALRLLAADVAEARGDAAGAAEALRGVLSTAPPPGGSAVQWNAFARAAAAAHATAKHARMLARLSSRHPGSVPCALMAASAAAAAAPPGAPAGGWAAALPALFRAFALAPRQPLTCLALGCALVQHAACRGHGGDRGAAVLAATGWLQRYAALRHAPAEASYNAARALHALNLTHLAAPLYEQALQEADEDAAAAAGESGGTAGTAAACGDVAREAAHNLALIYAASGADNLARALLRRYNTV
jgi:tetratricopeptide (TPR) repeat protein